MPSVFSRKYDQDQLLENLKLEKHPGRRAWYTTTIRRLADGTNDVSRNGGNNTENRDIFRDHPKEWKEYLQTGQQGLIDALEKETDPEVRATIAWELYCMTAIDHVCHMPERSDASAYILNGQKAIIAALSKETNSKTRGKLSGNITSLTNKEEFYRYMTEEEAATYITASQQASIAAFKKEKDPKTIQVLAESLHMLTYDAHSVLQYLPVEKRSNHLAQARDAYIEVLRQGQDKETSEKIIGELVQTVSSAYSLSVLGYDDQKTYASKSLVALSMERDTATNENSTETAAYFQNTIDQALKVESFYSLIDHEDLQSAGYLDITGKTGAELDKQLAVMEMFLKNRISATEHTACDRILEEKMTLMEQEFSKEKTGMTSNLATLSENQQILLDYNKIRTMRTKCTMSYAKI